jgi:nitrate reductase cytochrome c-type subunit
MRIASRCAAVEARPGAWKKEIIMRRRTRRRFWLGTLFLLPLLAAGAAAGGEPAEVDDGMDVYFRESALGAVAAQELALYIETEAGESLTLERSFPDAPPQIPHNVEGMLPITGTDNECLECHHPDNVASEEEQPVPESHFQRAVMGKGKPGQEMVWVVQGYEKADDVVGSRYHCTMCHAPQATNVRTPETWFITVKPAAAK